jgi:UPF0755 protein
MRLALRIALVAGLLVLALSLVVAAILVRQSRPYAAWEGEYVDVELEPGIDAATVLERLRDAGVIREPLYLRAWLYLRGGSGGLQAGEYRFREAATPLEVLERLLAGDVLLHPVTLPEGLVLEQVAQRLAEAGFGAEERFVELFASPGPVLDLDPQATDLEGYLYPETYHFPRSVRPETVAQALVARFREVAGADYAKRAEAVGLSLRQAVTLASMIEKETSLPGERGRVSRVFHNRLARGMLMQCDPTVLYAWHREGEEVERLTYRHLELDSPWNTYVHRGLPPGPIASPGGESLAAAVRPPEGKELYFVASPDGGHRFSNDLATHERAVREWRDYLRSSR